jgi:hypothetical protein
MKSLAEKGFWNHFDALPEDVQLLARQAFDLWQRDPRHPGLQFKLVRAGTSVYSVRIGLRWRALGRLHGDTVYWYWIGSHSDYDREIRKK